jgi:hypothetical protein
MTKLPLLLAGALAGAALAAPANAATARCFDSFGAPVGPTFDTLYPNYHWIQWVQTRGGNCRAMTPDDTALYGARVLDYPPEYTASFDPDRRAAPPPAGELRSQPPSTATSIWLGDTGRAAALITASVADRGRPALTVADTGRVIYRTDGVWRVYDVTWADGDRRQIAVHMRPESGYFAIESHTGDNWSSAVFIGR